MGRIADAFNIAMRNIRERIGRMRLKNMLMMFFVIILILPISIVVNITLKYSKQIISDEAGILVSNTISSVNTSIDEMIQGKVINIWSYLLHDERIHEILTKKYDYKNGDGSRMVKLDELNLSNKILQQYTATYDNIKIAILYGKNGEVYNISYPKQEESLLKHELEKLEDEMKTGLGTIRFLSLQQNIFNAQPPSKVRESNVVFAVTRLFDYNTTQYKGICVFTIYEQAIYEKYKNVKIGKTGSIFIIDGNGDLISHMDEKSITSGKADKIWVKNALENKNNSFTFSESGKTYLGFTQTSDITGWTTVGIVPLNELTENMRNVTISAYTIMIIAILITILAAIVISINITKPISNVIESMKKFTDGDFDIKIEKTGGYEVRMLAGYFNIMVGEIRELILKEYELEKKKKEAELYVLQAQINPHFLYNTLESIVWKAKAYGADDICYMTSALGKLFRLAVNKGGPITRVREEIEHVTAYMEIQNVRYNGRMRLSVNIDDEALLEYKTLKLILQPIVENAIIHGFEATEVQGLIYIEVYIDKGNLVFSVTDNGIGMSQEVLDMLNARLDSNYKEDRNIRRGIGLVNIHQRIELYFGKGYGISVSSVNGNGTIVTLTTPLIKDD